jgi:hypothetical protein
VSQCKECVSELSLSSERERARRAHQNIYRLKGGSSRLLNTLEERLCRGGTKRNKIVEDFVELCQEGIEQVQGVHKRTLFRVQREEKCQGEDTHRVVEYSRFILRGGR